MTPTNDRLLNTFIVCDRLTNMCLSNWPNIGVFEWILDSESINLALLDESALSPNIQEANRVIMAIRRALDIPSFKERFFCSSIVG
jgi:hypothetical protein